ncbi:hypothetical protein [Marinomonas transparens]|uniref:Uncharacterized protein n=1 Tax=Marinomonas transparens TaxID=2795388 RepID=A0A934JQ37_9GAMM|nr:hypothetical protein [Marinomonas transparens]MBJ7539866.1 hypothetical protein [Marinomonas transparens]
MSVYHVTFSIDGWRRNLSEDLSELKGLVEEIEKEYLLDDENIEVLKDLVSRLICKSNSFNCVSCKSVEDFSDLSDVEILLFGEAKEGES